MLKIVGLLVKKIINDYCERHNCDFTYKKIEDEEFEFDFSWIFPFFALHVKLLQRLRRRPIPLRL